MSDRLLTTKEAAEILKVHWQTVRSYIRKGGLRAIKVGRNVRIRESDLEDFVNQKRAESRKYEVEIRFLTQRRKKIEEKLVKLGAKITYHAHVVDHWYVPNQIRNLDQKDDWFDSGRGYGLRVREQDNGYTGKITTSLEVKRLLVPHQHDTCLEQDLDVGNYQEANRLLNLIDFKEMIAINKDRVVYAYQEFKIVIDEIKDFGTGVEIELVTEEKSEQVIPEMKALAKKIGLDPEREITDKSVTYLVMEKRARF